MSDWIEKDGKRYLEAGYLEMANNTAKRRGERIKQLAHQRDALVEALETSNVLLDGARHYLPDTSSEWAVRMQVKATTNRALLSRIRGEG